MTQLGSLFFCIELLLANVIFLFPCPRRNKFWLRLVISCVVCMTLSYFFPMPKFLWANQFYAFFRQILLLCYVLAVIAVCFDLKPHIIFSLGLAASTVQHISYMVVTLISLTPLLNGFTGEVFTRRLLLECIFMPLVYLAFFFTFGLFAAKNEYYKVSNKYLNYLAIAIIIINNVVTRIPRALEENEAISVNIYDMIVGFIALVMQFVIYHTSEMAYKNAMEKRMWQEEKKQYELTHDTIEAINIKCHDLKHRLRTLGVAPDSAEENAVNELIGIYDNSIKTGNEVLDVLLMDYKLRYASQGVEINYVGDGSSIDFMEKSDVFSLVGNAFENAVEAVLKLDETEKRQISARIESKGEYIFLNVTNYFCGNIVSDEGLPSTSKEYEIGDHGFGLKSMKKIARRYGGDMKINIDGDIFNLSIYVIKN